MGRKRNRDYVANLYDGFRNNPSQNRHTQEEQLYLRMFSEIACARFNWVGLPSGIDPRFLERTLFGRGLCVFYFDHDFDRYLALKAAGTGKVNMYDNPTSFTVIGNTMVNKTLAGSDCVPIWGNSERMPEWDVVTLYATRLAQLDVTFDINAIALRHPFVVIADDNTKLSLINAYRQVREGQPVIVGTQALNTALEDSFKVLDMRVESSSLSTVQLAKSKVWNEAMTFLGVNNSNQDKKERLVESEVSANDNQVEIMRLSALNARRIACEAMNSMYDLSVSVHWNEDIDSLAGKMVVA